MDGLTISEKKMDQATRQRFTNLCKRLGIAADRVDGMFDDLTKHYSEGHRSYHNLSHINRMLAWLDASPGKGAETVELAIWYHDAIYEPMSGQNEVKSAQYFRDHLGTFIGDHLVEDVVRLILATDPTRSRTGRNDEDLIIDIDLSILGSAPDDYEAYRRAIRSEYSSVPEANFNAGRKSILQRFLSQRIYVTEFFASLEEQARLNMKNEIACLE